MAAIILLSVEEKRLGVDCLNGTLSPFLIRSGGKSLGITFCLIRHLSSLVTPRLNAIV